MENENSVAAAALNTDFWQCVAPCRHTLYAFIRKALNYSEDADDIFQETVLRAQRYFHTFKPDLSFRAWLYSIAHNELKKHFKQRQQSPEPLPSDQTLGLVAAGLDAHELNLARELHQHVLQLKPAWREVFLLHYQDGFNAAETAAITGHTHANVRFMLFRARQHIRAQVGDFNEKK